MSKFHRSQPPGVRQAPEAGGGCGSVRGMYPSMSYIEKCLAVDAACRKRGSSADSWVAEIKLVAYSDVRYGHSAF